ncbi:N-acetylglucosamine kinase [Saccharolobus shibatae]|uniref:Eukaryotic-like N-acetylglucosamine kinase n=2 Tax=Saccharolobus shibatae TaxID=2286 RepID=A0A8F5BYG1_9CREN|nr:N-acetylglucosamine kinase [Saccharolobus shibatae]QXJ27408.1 Kinase similar to eukaryotic-like N-acetylglucosamine kinase [Saccharolobus shibatae B12]QXJ30713.1 eukaryotic-like N-acetylglucosamine kinase [Saccharolobus shibatae]QXJ33741.1 Kinase similar to eukaryotic-like N-acetylglucosamine kinase [Saccharolobus shibatae]
MILVGVDGGGSKTSAIAYTCSGSFLGKGLAGPANFHNVGVEETVKNVNKAILLATKGMKPDVAYIGLAGIDSKYDYNVMSEALRLVAKDVYIDHDGFVALYAETRGNPGVIVIAGTGSVIVGYDGNRRVRFGGLGWLIADEGSAYWIGREALRAFGKMLDGRMNKTLIAEKIMRSLNINNLDDLIKWAYHEGHKVKEIASLSKIVDEAANEGDEIALNILKSAAFELASDAVKMAVKIGVDKIYLKGGMFSSPIYFSFFRSYLDSNNIRGIVAEHEPEQGALLLAFKRTGCDINVLDF